MEDIYEQLQETEYIQRGRYESESAVEQLTAEFLSNRPLSKETVKDGLYGLVTVAERNGFYTGFRYAVNLLMECGNEKVM